MRYDQMTMDAGAVAGYVSQARTYIEPGVNMMRYPEFNYAELVPIDTSAPDWTQVVEWWSGDMYGRAQWFNANNDDVPTAGQNRQKGMSTVHTASIGYGYGYEELMGAMQAGRNLPAEDAIAARRAAEDMINRICFIGDTEKNLHGVVNHPAVTPRAAANGGWDTATVDEILADINEALSVSYKDTKYTSIADTVLLPYARLIILSTRRMTDVSGLMTSGNLLEYIQKYNLYTMTTGRPLNIKAVFGLETAGTGGVARMVAYRRSPEVLKLHMPMPHRFFPVWQSGPFRWDIPGLFRLGGVDARRPLEITYMDGI